MSDSSDTSESYESSSSDDEYYGDNGNHFINTIINKQYILIKKIGYGAYSSVWLSYNYTNGKYNAIKIQNPEDYKDGLVELKILKKIRNINCIYISNLIDNFTEIIDNEKYICMVFELCACSLYTLVKNNYKLDIISIKKIIKQSLIALNELHKLGYYHTDIKPENILLVGKTDSNLKLINDYNNMKFVDLYNKFKTEYFINNKLNKKNKNHIKKFNKNMKEKLLLKTNKIILEALNSISEDNNNSEDNEISIDNINSEDNEISINKIYIEDMNIKLTDFGTVHDIESGYYNDITTRYYKAPEVIMGLVHNEKIDIWGVGCLLLELLTNEIFFDPIKNNEYTRDFYHLYEIQKYCGKIPDYIIDKSPIKHNYFKKYKFKMKIHYSSLDEYLKNNNIYDNDLLDFIQNTLNPDYKKRYSCEQCLNCNWLKIYK